jgi:tRNA (guanosine-2'-O-)-methyltransferase
MILFCSMDETTKNSLLIDHFSKYISDHKKEFLDQVLNQRTRHITMVLEEIYQSQNASAVIRTCECMGIQDIHIVENEVKYSVNRRVLKGSYKWVDLIKYKGKDKSGAATCFEQLKKQGYKILVTDPSPDGVSIYDLPIDQKMAVVMGNELHGTSEFALSQADMKVRIPMYGFTESLNISVSAAICLNTLVPKMRASEVPWQLSQPEKDEIRLRWLRRMMKRPEIMEREFLRSIL